MPASCRSSLLGAVDVAYNLCRRSVQPKTQCWFSAGYGDLQGYYDLADHMLAEWKRDSLKRHLGTPLQVDWRPVDSGDPAVLCDEGSFVSPLAASLPEEVRTARFLFVRAAPGGTLPPTRCVVVHTAATGVVDYTWRDARMARPLLQHGIASAILMAPYNGSRAPAGQDSHYIDNVADYMKQSLAIILEGAALLRWLVRGFAVAGRSEHPKPLQLGVAGLSWGGAMAACISLLSKLPVACMVGLGADSPRALATGCIAWQLNWEALQRERQQTREEAQREIEAVSAWSKGRLWRGRAHPASLLPWEPLAPACSTLSGGATEPLRLPLEAMAPSPGCPKVAHFAAFGPLGGRSCSGCRATRSSMVKGPS